MATSDEDNYIKIMDEDVLQIGDLVEFKRRAYSHWVVYAGKGYVIHLATDPDIPSHTKASAFSSSGSSLSGSMSKMGRVQVTPFQEAKGQSPAYKHNILDDKHEAKSQVQILWDAISSVGEKGYNVSKWNCEQYATNIRYGVSESKQVKDKRVFGSGHGEKKLVGKSKTYLGVDRDHIDKILALWLSLVIGNPSEKYQGVHHTSDSEME